MNKLDHITSHFTGRKSLICIFIICLLIGALSGFKYYNESPTGDAGYYYRAALLLEEHFANLFHSPKIGVIESFNVVFQGIVFKLPGNEFLNVYALQIIIFSITGVLIFSLTRKFIGILGATVTVLFYIINYRHWAHIYNFKPGVWVNLFIVLTLYYAFLVFKNPDNRKNYIWIGVFSAFLLLTDLRYLPHLMFMYFTFLFSQACFSQKHKNISISVGVLIVLITPWVIRQSIVFDRFVFISDYNTLTIHRAFDTPPYRSLTDYSDTLAGIEQDEYEERFWELSESLGLSPGQLIYAWAQTRSARINASDIPISEKYKDIISANIFTEEEIASIIEHKENQSWLLKRINRASSLWSPFRFSYRYDPLHRNGTFLSPASTLNNFNRIATIGIFLPFMLVGLFYIIKRINMFGIVLMGFFVSHTVVHALTSVQWRYMLPILPFVTMVAFYGANELWVRLGFGERIVRILKIE